MLTTASMHLALDISRRPACLTAGWAAPAMVRCGPRPRRFALMSSCGGPCLFAPPQPTISARESQIGGTRTLTVATMTFRSASPPRQPQPAISHWNCHAVAIASSIPWSQQGCVASGILPRKHPPASCRRPEMCPHRCSATALSCAPPPAAVPGPPQQLLPPSWHRRVELPAAQQRPKRTV